jgi:hypothetical protein
VDELGHDSRVIFNGWPCREWNTPTSFSVAASKTVDCRLPCFQKLNTTPKILKKPSNAIAVSKDGISVDSSRDIAEFDAVSEEPIAVSAVPIAVAPDPDQKRNTTDEKKDREPLEGMSHEYFVHGVITKKLATRSRLREEIQ